MTGSVIEADYNDQQKLIKGGKMLEVKEIEIDKIKPWDKNPRINDHAVEAVAKSIKNFGFNVPIMLDQDGTIIAGHTRWKAAKALGMSRVPAIQIQMEETQRKAFSIADNKTAEIADWDFPALNDILHELKLEDIKMPDLGFSDEDIRKLINEVSADMQRTEDQFPEMPSEAITKPEDLIVLGNHRLFCGDSMDINSIGLLIGGNQIDHIFGSPPYFNHRAYAHWENHLQYLEDMRIIIVNCKDILKDGGIIVWNIANHCSEGIDLASHHSLLFEQSGLEYLDYIIWCKTGANYSIPRNCHIINSMLYYPALQWEALLVYQKPGEMPRMTREAMKYMKEHHTNVWEISAITNQMEKFGHPAVCPVEIPYRTILAYTSSEGETVFEPFGGSGTTLIAAEKTKRKALLMERNPIYCDMIIKRWETMTQQKAERITSK
jgi:DNA modification methylase